MGGPLEGSQKGPRGVVFGNPDRSSGPGAWRCNWDALFSADMVEVVTSGDSRAKPTLRYKYATYIALVYGAICVWLYGLKTQVVCADIVPRNT